MEKKYVLERSRLRGLVMNVILEYGGGNLKVDVADLDKLIDEYVTESDEVAE